MSSDRPACFVARLPIVLGFAASLAVLGVCAGVGAGSESSASPEGLPILREGTVRVHTAKGLHSYIEAVDERGGVFHVVSSLCQVEPGQVVRVLTGSHYRRMRVPALGGEVEDVYVARTLELDGRRVSGFTNDSMIPQGCIILD